MLLNEQQIQERIQTNKALLDLPKSLQTGNLPSYSADILIRQFYFEAEMHVNEAGIIEPLYRVGESDGGRPVARQDHPDFQPRGVIVKLSEKAKAEGLEVGQIVWIPIHVAASQAYEFLVEKESIVDKPCGFKKIPYRLIEYIEQEKYSNN